MNALEEQALKLPKTQKISLMETLWSDLTKDAAGFSPPDWHLNELEKTEQRLAAGEETFEDWSEAKRRMREA